MPKVRAQGAGSRAQGAEKTVKYEALYGLPSIRTTLAGGGRWRRGFDGGMHQGSAEVQRLAFGGWPTEVELALEADGAGD